MKMKNCTKCKEAKPGSAFGKRASNADGLSAKCRECANAYNRKHRKAWRASNKDKVRGYNRRSTVKKYGLSLNEYEYLLQQQNECCKACGTHQSQLRKQLAVDHCHVTGVIRGLLCTRCNVALGLCEDNTGLLLELVEYLLTGKTG